MPIHDWTRVDSGLFHCFHTAWIVHLMEALNADVLPAGYVARAEQVVSRRQADVLTLRTPSAPPHEGDGADPAVAVMERAVPARRRSVTRRRIAVVHRSGARVVAIIEIPSRANFDRPSSVRTFSEKITESLEAGVSCLMTDVWPPARATPAGLHAAVWQRATGRTYTPPPDRPLTFAAYVWRPDAITAYLEPTAVGRPVPDMPLYLTPDLFVTAPLDATYAAAFRGIAADDRAAVE